MQIKSGKVAITALEQQRIKMLVIGSLSGFWVLLDCLTAHVWITPSVFTLLV